MRHLSTIVALLLLATSQPFVAASGILCGVNGKDCPASVVTGINCCCESECNCDTLKNHTPAPTKTASEESPRADFALIEIPTVTPAARETELFEPVRIAAELTAVHALPRVAVTCIRLN